MTQDSRYLRFYALHTQPPVNTLQLAPFRSHVWGGSALTLTSYRDQGAWSLINVLLIYLNLTIICSKIWLMFTKLDSQP